MEGPPAAPEYHPHCRMMLCFGASHRDDTRIIPGSWKGSQGPRLGWAQGVPARNCPTCREQLQHLATVTSKRALLKTLPSLKTRSLKPYPVCPSLPRAHGATAAAAAAAGPLPEGLLAIPSLH